MARVAVVTVLFISLVGQIGQPHSSNKTNQADTATNPTSLTAPVGEPDSAESKDFQQYATQNQGSSANPIWVHTPDKGLSDWIAYGANLLLAVVGVAGIVAAFLTLRKIRYQADEMKLQRVATEETLEAMRKQGILMERQADAMDLQLQIVKGKDRGRLRIDLDQPGTQPVLLKSMGGITLYCLGLKIVLEGDSHAEIIEGKELTRICKKDVEPTSQKLVNCNWPRFLNQKNSPFTHYSTVFIDGEANHIGANQNFAEELRRGEKYFLFEAYFRYRDVFGDIWCVRMKQKFNFVFIPDEVRAIMNPEILTGRWDDEGEPSENKETRQNPIWDTT